MGLSRFSTGWEGSPPNSADRSLDPGCLICSQGYLDLYEDRVTRVYRNLGTGKSVGYGTP